jgi:tripartite-type tricarboxylate transporter receptor subunit TctC
VSHWCSGALRPLCVFDDTRLPVTDRMTDTQAWSDIPTCKEQRLDLEYLMLRGIFMPPGVQPAQVAFYEGLLARLRETPEWKELMAQGAFNTTSLTGEPFRAWLEKEEARHRALMQEAGFIAGSSG